jgi:hypothetical protein
VRRYDPGEWIILREVHGGRTWEKRLGLVVRDEEGVIAVYTPPATPAIIAAGPDGRRLRLPGREWDLRAVATPADRAFLAVHPPGAAHSVLLICDAGLRLLHWYINLEDDLVRTEAGFEYTDHFLDVVVTPDLTAWSWKDEDELAEAVELGILGRDRADALYAEGRAALEALTARRSPFDEPWEDWRPPPDWPLAPPPTLG